jgi:hypothetical protein
MNGRVRFLGTLGCTHPEKIFLVGHFVRNYYETTTSVGEAWRRRKYKFGSNEENSCCALLFISSSAV